MRRVYLVVAFRVDETHGCFASTYWARSGPAAIKLAKADLLQQGVAYKSFEYVALREYLDTTGGPRIAQYKPLSRMQRTNT